MTQESIPFPNHLFDFADVVLVLPLQENGIVQGIRHRDERWYYEIDLGAKSDDWWREDQLAFAVFDSSADYESTASSTTNELPSENSP